MYTTDEKVKDFITVPADMGTTELKQYIKIVSAFMDKKVGYKIGYIEGVDAVQDILFDGSGTDVIDFGKYWITGMGVVTQDDIVITDDVLAYPLNSVQKYQLVKKIGDFCEGRGAIKIADAKVGAYIVNWKEADHTLPEELEFACTTLVASIIRTKKAGGVQTAGKVTSEKTSAYSITFSEGAVGTLGADEVTAMASLDMHKDNFIA